MGKGIYQDTQYLVALTKKSVLQDDEVAVRSISRDGLFYKMSENDTCYDTSAALKILWGEYRMTSNFDNFRCTV